MTRGRMDGSYIHSVSYYHQAHPDYVFDASANTVVRYEGDTDNFGSDPTNDDAAAAAEASNERDGGDALQERDAS